MKPIKLTMTAFGPYKSTEIIDFKELEENQLFVISGNTGAGKTTIFDGICFALYGSASGGDRDETKMLRSHFADDSTHTAVELLFSIQEHTYRILRQLGHIKQGNKTKTGEHYELYEILDDREVPCVDRQIVSEIDKKLERIIGLTQDQFKQIVMLPQGEFRKLLTSQTENKEAILRRLFKTENYKHLNELLRNKKNGMEQEFNQLKQLQENQSGSIAGKLPVRDDSELFFVLQAEHHNDDQIITGLQGEVNFYQVQIVQDQKYYEEKYQLHNEKAKVYHSSEALNERFLELDKKQEWLNQLSEQEATILEKEKKLQKAEQANTIVPYEQHVNVWKESIDTKAEIRKQTDAKKSEAGIRLKQAETNYMQEETKTDLREKTGKQQDQLYEFLPIVKEMDTSKQQLESLAADGKKTAIDLDKIKLKIESKTKSADELNSRLKEMDKHVSELPGKQQKLAEIREQVKTLMAYLKLKEKQQVLMEEKERIEKVYTQLHEKYQSMEINWINNQASVLAAHLHEGEACPVCGSEHHPKLAVTMDNMVSKEQLEVLRGQVAAQERLFQDAKVNQNANLAQIKEKEADIKQYNISLDMVSIVNGQLTEEGKQLKTEVQALISLQEKLQQQKEQYEAMIHELKQLQLQKDRLDKEYQERRTSYETSRAVYLEQMKNIPEEIRNLAKLEDEIKRIDEQKSLLEQKWDAAQKLLQRAKEDQAKAVIDHDHAEKDLTEADGNWEDAKKQFEQALKQAEFISNEDYKEAKMPKDTQQHLKNEIAQFKQHYTTTKQQVAELKETLKDKTRIDLDSLKQELEKLKQVYEQAFSKWNMSKEYYQRAAEIKQKMMETSERMKQQEKQLAAVADLFDMLRGQNSQKISFERYLQIEYLEQIIDAANERLRKLSNGQFYLIRSDRQEAHGRQSGLALDVYDSYTGQTRDVKTLSGGEKFNASLCLALGMSDIIQSFQGNIAINTMFIDEGFGSLDEESLNKSIDTLVDLQHTGRMIGVISHVQELKNMFPAILQVIKTKEGHSQTKFVLK